MKQTESFNENRDKRLHNSKILVEVRYYQNHLAYVRFFR